MDGTASATLHNGNYIVLEGMSVAERLSTIIPNIAECRDGNGIAIMREVFQQGVMWSSEYGRRAAEMRERNEREHLATRLGHDHLWIAEVTAPTTGAIERHYSVKEIGLFGN